MTDDLLLDGETLENKVVIARKELERMREVQKESKHSRGIGMLLIAYGEEIVPGKRTYFRDKSSYVKEFLVLSTLRTWFDGRHHFPLKHMKGLVDELDVSKKHLEYVAGRNPFEVTEEELEEWSREKTGLRKLFNYYINLNFGMFTRQYLGKKSEYVKKSGLHPLSIGSWLSGNCSFPVEHIKYLAEEIGVPSEQVKRVTGVDLDEFKVQTWEDMLDEFRIEQEKSRNKGGKKTDKGIGKLIEAYIYAKGLNVAGYIREHSEYARKEGLKLGTIRNGLNGNDTLALKHLRGIVRELRVPQVELEYVAGKDPFTPTDDELERWSNDKNGLGALFGFYTNLSLGLSRRGHLHGSEYRKREGLSYKKVRTWFYRIKTFPPYHLKNLAEEVGVPPEMVKRVSGIDLSNVDSTREGMIEEFKRVESEDPTKGVGLLIRNYIARRGFTVKEYIHDNCKYLSESGIKALALCQQVIGQKKLHLKHMNGLVDELEVDQEELEYVAGRNPFEPTEEELEKWGEDEIGIGRLLDFYIELRHAIPRIDFLRRSDYIDDNDIKITTAASWFTKHFRKEHIKPLAEELGVPPDYIKRVSGIDIGGVKSAEVELTEALVGFLDE